MSDENPAKRESQSIALLQKLIRLDSKDCNFHFKDPLMSFYFKVAYQQTNIDNHSSDALLRQFWHHIYAHYFKKIQYEEMRPNSPQINHLGRTPFNSLLQKHSSFEMTLNQIFNSTYLSKLSQQSQDDKQIQLWLKRSLMQFKVQQEQQVLPKEMKKRVKGLYSKLKQNRKHRLSLKTQKHKKQSIKKDQQEINSLLEQICQEKYQVLSPIDRQIRDLEAQAAQIQGDLQHYVTDLEDKIQFENNMIENRAFSRNIIYASGSNQDFGKDLQCLQYLIDCLEEKQIAESVSKIISTERNSGETMFKIDYEKAMNIEPKLITEKQLMRTNFLRQTSLINFYRTGVKSLFSYICHNYVGFRELMQNRFNVTSKMKDKDVIQMMKKGACLATVTDIQHEMSKFHMCHHCKFLYQDHMLFTCKFTSDKQAIPKINIEASCDPNLAEDFQEGPHRNRTSQRFMTRKKNCLTSYAKIHDQYVCGRKYCISCIKQNYSHENIKQNGLCPFCLGVCMCTRCLRNQKIAKFKTMYSMLGGDVAVLQTKSNLDHLQVKNDDQIPRGRGRPKKYMVSHIAINATKKKLRRFGDQQDQSINVGLQLTKKDKRGRPHWQSILNTRKKLELSNQTQEQQQPRMKIKRKVGRPRLDRSKLDQRRR